MKRLLALAFALWAGLCSTAFAQEDELLMPDEAFRFQLETVDAQTVRAIWDIADGYYLYRSKLSFVSDTDGIGLGEPRFPAGKVKKDEFFGEVETYRGRVVVEVPLDRGAGAPSLLKLTANSQGCADIGVCYPPHRQSASVELPAAAAVTAASPLRSLFEPAAAAAGSYLGEGDVLDPEVAFVFSAEVVDPNTLRARWDIAPEHYLYREKFTFELKGADGVVLGSAVIPKGEEKHDEFFGDIQVFHDRVEALLPLERNRLEATKVTLVAGYQGCADAGICYPPMKKETGLTLPTATVAKAALPVVTAAAVAAPAAEPLSEQDSLAAALAGGSTLLTLLTFLGLGLLLAFTPCVFPMIPILSSIIVGHGATLTTRKAFTLSMVYVLAMAATYTVAGVIAGLFGANLQAMFQNPWVLGSFAAIFVALALSMFGFYELQLPSALQSKLTEVSNRQRSGTLTGVAIMGLLSALIVGPCVAPPLMGALIYIGQTGDPWLGGAALFALSMGMGAPLVAIGTAHGQLLPRAGAWMGVVKAVFGVLLLGVAIWMLERVLPAFVAMLLWALLLIISAIYMGALEPVRDAASGWKRLWKGLGVVLLIYGGLLLIGTASGGRDPLEPLLHLRTAMGGPAAMAGGQAAHLQFERVKSVEDLGRAVKAAAAKGQPVMLDFYADWCISCKEMEKYTFSDQRVADALSGVRLLQADVTANDDADKALLKSLGLIGPPAIIFYGADGQEKRNYRVVGFKGPEEFAAHVRRALGKG
jgi:thiol:disulfide interchange protein DsbD